MICKTIKDCSSEVFEWISNQHEVGEESITDWFLYRTNQLSANIQYLQFNRHQEARVTGADFELWILTNNFHFKARIQAKRLRPNDDHYSSIHYSNQYGLQIEKLRLDALNNGFRPLYALYNNEQKTSRCNQDIKDEGVYLADADELYRDIVIPAKQVIDTDYLISRSIPISCWFCCPLCNRSKHDSLVEFLGNYFPNVDENDDLPIGITKEIPPYISHFLGVAKEQVLEGWKQEFEEQMKGVKRLIVIDNRNEEQS